MATQLYRGHSKSHTPNLAWLRGDQHDTGVISTKRRITLKTPYHLENPLSPSRGVKNTKHMSRFLFSKFRSSQRCSSQWMFS